VSVHSRIVTERTVEQEQRGPGFFIPETQQLFFGSLDGLEYSRLALFRVDIGSLATIDRSPVLYDLLRDLAHSPAGDVLAGCTWRKIFLFLPKGLAIMNRIEGLGEGFRCLGFDRAGDHLVVGSTLRQTVRIIDARTGRVVASKRSGKFTRVLPDQEPHQVILFHGPTGRIVWFDCAHLRVSREIHSPPFGDVAGSKSAVFLATGTAEPHGYVPTSHAEKFVTTSGESPFAGHVPMAGTELVATATGLARVDLQERAMSLQILTDSIGSSPYHMIQMNQSGSQLFAFSKERVRFLSTDTLEVVADWTLPEGSFPLAVLRDGERAIVAFGQWGWSRVALVERSVDRVE
jgi:hypothetical protein